MANLGDIGRYKHVSDYWLIMYLPPDMLIHSLSDAALARHIDPERAAYGPNARKKGTTPFVILIEDAAAGENYLLAFNGIPADIPRRAKSNGDLEFYDLDDGVYVASSTASASAYRITVTGTTYTVEVLSGGGGITVADNIYGGVA